MATNVADLRLNVRIDEGQGPVIVLLHGINSNADDLRGLIDHLGTGYRIIAPDLLGFGDSPKPLDIEYTIDDHAQALEATLDALDLPGRFLLFGYSLGGIVAVRYAARNPERLRRLFLLSAPFYLPPEAYTRHGFGLAYAQSMLFTWIWKVVGRQKERQTPFYALASGKLQAPVEDFLRAGDLSTHWDIMARTLTNTISKATFIDDLPKLTMPTIFALGVRDPIVRPDQTLALQRIKPDLEVRRIMGLTADHVLITSTPERVAAEVLRSEADTLSVGLRTGAGAPLVLLPDLQQTWETWRETAVALATDHDIAVLDLLGFGASPAPLANGYTLEDHATAVLATARQVFGGQPFQITGSGFGADVALACAELDPTLVTRVVAVAPILPDPSRADTDPDTAQLLASRDVLVARGRDERMQRIGNEKLEQEVIPALRSMGALLAADAAELIGRVRVPARFVLPGRSTDAPAWLAERAAAEPSLVQLDTTPGVAKPERSSELVAAAVRGQALPALTSSPDLATWATRKDPITAKLGGLTMRLVIRGVLQLLLGLPLLFWPAAIPLSWVAVFLAAAIGVEAIQTVIGAVGLKRRGQGWLMWGAVGALGVVFALAILAGGTFAVGLLTWIIIIGAAVRGIALLAVAIKAPRTPGRRWLLLLDGVLSIAIAACLLFWPTLGARLLRYFIGGYLTAAGLSSLAFAYGNRRELSRRVQHYLTQSF